MRNLGLWIYIKNTLLLSIAFCLPTTAIAGWPVAITDNIAVHSTQRNFKEYEVLGNDIGQGLQVIEVNDWSEQGGNAKIVGGFAVSYRPPVDFEGEDGFWYVIRDSEGRTNSVRVSVTVLPASSPLSAPQDDFVQTPQNAPIRINVFRNDVWSQSDLNAGGEYILTLPRELSEKGGTIKTTQAYSDTGTGRFPENNQLIYTPPPGFVGVDTFEYFAQASVDSEKLTAKVTVEVLNSTTVPRAFPTASPVTASLTCPAGIDDCLTRPFSVLGNEQSELLLRLNSSWSLNGGKVEVIERTLGPSALLYTAPLSGFEGEDTVFFVIEDEYARKNWGALTINVARPPLD